MKKKSSSVEDNEDRHVDVLDDDYWTFQTWWSAPQLDLLISYGCTPFPR